MPADFLCFVFCEMCAGDWLILAGAYMYFTIIKSFVATLTVPAVVMCCHHDGIK